MHIPRQTTDRYPVRYAAFESPGILWENPAKRNDCGECAVYRQPQPNLDYPHLTDGIYAEVHSGWGGAFLFSGHYHSPNFARTQRGKVRRHATYEDALADLLEFIPEAEGWLKKALENHRRVNLSREQRKFIKRLKDGRRYEQDLAERAERCWQDGEPVEVFNGLDHAEWKDEFLRLNGENQG